MDNGHDDVDIHKNENPWYLGLAHIFHASFITPKQKFWCAQALDESGSEIPPPWSVPYGNGTVDVYPGNMTEDKKLLGHCVPGCVDYQFDHEFWEATMITEWDLVCENSWLKTLAKLLLFTGKDDNGQGGLAVYSKYPLTIA